MKQGTFVICINNTEYVASLEKRKIYETVPDNAAEKINHIRVIDESGEGYLYPATCFIDAHLSKEVESAIIYAA